MATPEGRVKAKLARALKDRFGTLLYRFMPVQNGMGAPALDYYCCYYGHFIAIETKVPGKNPTPRQENTMDAIRAARGLVFVVRTDEDIAQVCNLIARLNPHFNLNQFEKRGSQSFPTGD